MYYEIMIVSKTAYNYSTWKLAERLPYQDQMYIGVMERNCVTVTHDHR